MDLYRLIAQWTGWPLLVAVLLLGGGYAVWFLNNRLQYQKEINENMARDLKNLQGSGSSASGKTIGYRAVIKLIHDATGCSLHSHKFRYEHPGSSKQQQVTAFAGSNDDDYWIVKGPHNFPDSHKAGEPVMHGDIVRLEHMATRRNLHSHGGVPSPVSQQQEVTAFGENAVGDTNDNWRVDVEGGGVWLQDDKVRLIHERTGAALHSRSGVNLPAYGFNQQEVTCYAGRDQNDWWRGAVFKDAR